MTTFEKRIEKWAEHKVTAVVKKRFDDAGMEWKGFFTLDDFIYLICLLDKHTENIKYKAAELNCIKPVI